MSKKKKKHISKESKTCFIAGVIALVLGIGCIIYGNIYYNAVVPLEDVKTGVTTTVVAVEKVERNLSPSEKKIERDKGRSDDEVLYEYLVEYSATIDGKDYTYSENRPYYDNGKKEPKVGDTDVNNFAIVNGNLVVHPETKEANQFNICGWIIAIFGVIAFGVGLFIRK